MQYLPGHAWATFAGCCETTEEEFDPPLDAGIADMVVVLRKNGIETFTSCQGGIGHAFPEPTVRFHGDTAEGFRALAVAIKERLAVAELRRVWPIDDGEPTGPYLEMTFTLPTNAAAHAPVGVSGDPTEDSREVRGKDVQ